MSTPGARRVLAVVPDLFFSAKLAATAKAAGVELELVSPERAAARAAESGPSLVVLDLHAPDAVALVTALAAAGPGAPVVGFFSHVDTTLRDRALAAGAAAVLPRSRFVNLLPALLARGLAALGRAAPETPSS